MTPTRLLSLVAGAVMALSGCVYNDWGCKSPDDCGGCTSPDLCTDAPADAGVSTTCTVDSDCAAGTCLHNACHPVCQKNADCDADEYCVKGACRTVPPDAKTCTAAADCAKGQMCINGVCSSLCAADADCAAGQMCKDMFCTPKPVPVTPDAGTVEPTPEADAGTEVTPPDAGTTEPKTCQFNADCGEGLFCINSECHLGCASDNECPASQMCKVGICQARPPAECTTGADCLSGQDCVDATCKVRCSTGGQCQAGEICKLGYCTPGSGGACVTNCDCPASERCVAGVCQP